MARSFRKLFTPCQLCSIQTPSENNNLFAQYICFTVGKGKHEDTSSYQQAKSIDMDPGRPEKHDVCRDPELKANPDIAGICVSYALFLCKPFLI